MPLGQGGVDGGERADAMREHGIVDVHADHLIPLRTSSMPNILDPEDVQLYLRRQRWQ